MGGASPGSATTLAGNTKKKSSLKRGEDGGCAPWIRHCFGSDWSFFLYKLQMPLNKFLARTYSYSHKNRNKFN